MGPVSVGTISVFWFTEIFPTVLPGWEFFLNPQFTLETFPGLGLDDRAGLRTAGGAVATHRPR